MPRTVIRGRSAGAIAASVEEALTQGALVPGQRLPAIRALAEALGVSPVTVTAAYRALRARGLAAGDGRRGTRLTRPAGPGPPAAARGIEGLVDLASGAPDPELLPPLGPAWRAVTPAPHEFDATPVWRPLGTFAAGEFIADGIPVPALGVTNGAFDALERLLRDHARPGDRVAIEDPSPPRLRDLLDSLGLRADPVPMDEEGPRPDAFDDALARVRAAIVTARAHDPTGAALSAARAGALRALLRGHRDVLVIELDPLGPVSGVPVVPLCDGAHPQWAVIRPVSAFLGADLRLAVVAGDAVSMARLEARQALGPRHVSHLLQQLAHALWSDPANGRLLARAAGVYAQRRAAAAAAIAAEGVAVQVGAGFHLWIPVREETATVQALAARGWAVAAGERFRLRSAPAIRVTTSALAVDRAALFAADLAAAARPPAVPSWRGRSTAR